MTLTAQWVFNPFPESRLDVTIIDVSRNDVPKWTFTIEYQDGYYLYLNGGSYSHTFILLTPDKDIAMGQVVFMIFDLAKGEPIVHYNVPKLHEADVLVKAQTKLPENEFEAWANELDPYFKQFMSPEILTLLTMYEVTTDHLNNQREPSST